MKKLLLLLMFSVLLVSSISAVTYNSAHGYEFTNDSTFRKGAHGINVSFTTSTTIIGIAKSVQSNATHCYVRDDYKGQNLSTGTYVGDWCNLTSPYSVTAGVNYTILEDADGIMYRRVYNNTDSVAFPIPVLNDGMYWWGGWDTSGGYSASLLEGFDVVFGGTSVAPSISVSLISPTNNSQTADSPQTFMAQLTNDTYQLINATIYVWFQNGTIFGTQTNTTLNSVNTTNATFSMTLTTPSNYVWNVKGVQGNANGTNSSFATTNNSFLWGLVTGNEEYNTPVVEQSSQTFRINLTLSGFSISTVTLVYNGTNHTGSFASVNATTTQATSTFIVPAVAANTNYSFYWSITFTGSPSVITTTTHNQTVLDFGVDNCGVNTIQILNFTLVDEASQVKLNGTGDNTSIKVSLDFFTNTTTINPAFEFNSDYNETNPARVCIGSALANATYYLNAQVEYSASGYASEFYNIQRYNLNATANPSENITLYDLLNSTSQIFKIIYRDSSYLPIANALIQVGRLYVDEGTTKTVEIPITDSYGSTVANLKLNNVVYTFTVTKNGVVLGTFPNSIAVCQNPAISPCEINLNSLASNLPAINFTIANDFLYTLTYDNNTRTITSDFIIPSGAVSLIVLNVSTENALTTNICSTSATTSSGSLSCVIGSSFGNTTVRAELYKGGQLVGWGNINLRQTPEQLYGANLVFLSIFIMLTLIGVGISDNPVFMVVSLLVGVFLLMILNLTSNTGFIGGAASVLYLAIAIIIIIIKGVKRN